jgi:hypothetical protein
MCQREENKTRREFDKTNDLTKEMAYLQNFHSLTIGPTIKPNPKNVSRVAKVVPTEFGNSFAMIAKLEVRNAAFPNASTIRMAKARVMNIV